MSSLKSSIYRGLRVWNDIDAVKNGKILKRIIRKKAGGFIGKHALRRIR